MLDQVMKPSDGAANTFLFFASTIIINTDRHNWQIIILFQRPRSQEKKDSYDMTSSSLMNLRLKGHI